MNELLRLLTEFGATEDIIALVERFTAEDPESVEPLDADELDVLLGALMGLADEDEASVPPRDHREAREENWAGGQRVDPLAVAHAG